MYAIGAEQIRRTSSQAACLSCKPVQNESGQDSAFASMLETSNSVSDSEAPGKSQASTYRQLTPIDVEIQKDIQKEFGIEPYKPGEPLKSPMRSLWSLQSAKDGVITGNDLENNAEKAMGIFKKHFSRFMMNEGISSDPAIELNISGNGRVTVQADHPDKEKIESFINDNSELRNLYVGISSTKNLIAIGRESSEFQQKYAVDPKAAVAEFAHLFTGKYGYNTTVTIGKDGYNCETKPFWRISDSIS
jgi:hypothetical protein